MNDDALLARQADLQREAASFVRKLGFVEMLGRAGRVVPLGSAVTGLMVWRDVDFGVDAPALTADAAWETMHPVLDDAVLNHEVRALDELDAFLAARGLPTRPFSDYVGGGGES